MTRLIMSTTELGRGLDIDAEKIELHATVDGKRIVYSEPDASTIEWRTTGQAPESCRSVQAEPHGIRPIDGLHRPVRCDECAPEFGCFDGSMACRKRPIPSSNENQTRPEEARYHTFELRDSNRELQAHPPDWYDGKPKRCPGSGLAPGVQFHGELSDDGEPKYLVRCPWCDAPERPGPMPEHTFVPVDPDVLTFKTGKFMYGMEPDEDAPEAADVVARVRLVNGSAELLCASCNLPMNNEPAELPRNKTHVEVWHRRCIDDIAAMTRVEP